MVLDSQEGCVSEFYASGGWQLNFKKDFNDLEMEEVGQLIQLLSTAVVEGDKEGVMLWAADSDMKYSVKAVVAFCKSSQSTLSQIGHGK